MRTEHNKNRNEKEMTENKKQNFSINGGVIEMQKNKIIVLAD